MSSPVGDGDDSVGGGTTGIPRSGIKALAGVGGSSSQYIESKSESIL